MFLVDVVWGFTMHFDSGHTGAFVRVMSILLINNQTLAKVTVGNIHLLPHPVSLTIFAFL